MCSRISASTGNVSRSHIKVVPNGKVIWACQKQHPKSRSRPEVLWPRKFSRVFLKNSFRHMRYRYCSFLNSLSFILSVNSIWAASRCINQKLWFCCSEYDIRLTSRMKIALLTVNPPIFWSIIALVDRDCTDTLIERKNRKFFCYFINIHASGPFLSWGGCVQFKLSGFASNHGAVSIVLISSWKATKYMNLHPVDLVKSQCLLGEGPNYDRSTNQVLWVDVIGGKCSLFRLNLQYHLKKYCCLRSQSAFGHFFLAPHKPP